MYLENYEARLELLMHCTPAQLGKLPERAQVCLEGFLGTPTKMPPILAARLEGFSSNVARKIFFTPGTISWNADKNASNIGSVPILIC
jgi:hypothetical protein